jgi:5-methylcytosine-specific restriction endonuclease McrA
LKILPPRTLPPGAPIPRKHRPAPASHWSPYRACLRWEFGFTCAFCLLHEADLYGGQPGEGLAGTTVEHRIPRSSDPTLENSYENCLYACRLCNRSRSAHPLEPQGATLLDPTQHSWSDHFILADDLLRPVAPSDAAAAYTHRTYQLDDPRKVVRRRTRRELIDDRLQILGLSAEIPELLSLADTVRQTDLRRFGEILREIQRIRDDSRRALQDLERYPGIPADAPETCRCGESADHRLPGYLEEQMLEIPLTPDGLPAPP